MKELGLFRHGKSDWGAHFEADRDRPLAPRGVKAARLMGSFLAGRNLVPQVVYSSPAVRANATANEAAEAGKWECSIRVVESLYDTSPESVFDFLRREDPDSSRILLVGHNPAWEDLLSSLVGGGNFKMATGSLAWVRLTVGSWEDCGPGSGVLRWLVTPKLLGQLET